jgi:PncC family amidohydrolase
LGETIEKRIGEVLRKRGWTLSVAESCTGGQICDRITDVPGSSEYFLGGMVTYSNESKRRQLGVPKKEIDQFGAVSAQVAKRMAIGVRKRFEATFGLSTTGIAGPSGGTPEKPVGLVYIGLAKGRRVFVVKLNLKGSRKRIKRESTHLALRALFQFIKKAPQKEKR